MNRTVPEELTHSIIGAAMKVYNTLGSGFLESVYEKAMIWELAKRGHRVQAQFPIAVDYDGQTVGTFHADLFVDSLVIVELKAAESLAKIHEVQLVNYLKGTGVEVGLLVNFAPKSLEYKRKTRTLRSADPAESSESC